MIQSSTIRPGELDEIVARLIATFHPTRIFLFGSRARGDARADSDYDFLVEIDKPPSEEIRITGSGMTWLEDFPEIGVQVHLRLPGALERRQNDPGRIDWDVAREGKLVYASDVLPAAPISSRIFVKEPSPEPPESLREWIEQAEKDLRVAAYLASNFAEFRDAICFHSQQAAEKFLKALVISHHRHPARTHKLRDLLANLREIGVTLDDLAQDCGFLTRFAVERYPPKKVTEDDARRALPAAERIAAAVRSRLP